MKNRTTLAFVLGIFGGFITLYGIQALAQPPNPHQEHFSRCAKACADCQVSCDACFHHCAALTEMGNKGHVKAMHTCVDCAEFCALAAKLSARQSPFSATACGGCAKSCDVCAQECEKFKDDKHMTECAKLCRDCAKSCRIMIEHLKY